MKKTIDIDVCISQTLSKNYTIKTSDFETEHCGEDTWYSLTKSDFTDDFKDSGYRTPEELIKELGKLCESLLEGNKSYTTEKLIQLIGECAFWTVDETIAVINK